MKTQLYAVYDVTTEVYGRPFHQINKAEAIRSMTNLVNDPNSEIFRNPQCYQLFYLGDYDDANAQFELTAGPQFVAACHELTEIENNA